ncbi:MAG: hypothetical protein KatS3mg102_2405 [Planctomycetota bacterium]|nr:MAG: hypothetical protein KatS3mg102_2405 [Planctomycetota bacterium]
MRVRPAPERIMDMGSPGSAALEVRWLGRMEYGAALALQEQLLQAVAAGTARPVLLLLEHEPVFTVGRGLQRRPPGEPPPRLPPAVLPAGIPRFEVRRGGGLTYHGPGQLVGYPIVPLLDRDLHGYLRRLEAALIEGVAAFGIEARARRATPGCGWRRRRDCASWPPSASAAGAG